MATDLGLSGSPSVHLWVQVEKEITKKLSSVVHDSTSQLRQRLDHLHESADESRKSTDESRKRLDLIESLLHESRLNHIAIQTFLHESTNESRQRFEHIELLLLNSQQHVGLQTDVPNIRDNMSEDIVKNKTPNGETPIVPWRQELRFEEFAVEQPPAARQERGVRQERAAQMFSPYTNMVQVTHQIIAMDKKTILVWLHSDKIHRKQQTPVLWVLHY